MVCFLFNSLEDAEEVLNKVWVVNNDSLMLKHWHCAFNPKKEVICYRHLWVLMPGFRLQSGTWRLLRRLETRSGNFYMLIQITVKALIGGWGKCLVEIDLFEGLPTEIEIEWCGTVIQRGWIIWGCLSDVQSVRRRDTCDINVVGIVRK
jgi:hypothetical protein